VAKDGTLSIDSKRFEAGVRFIGRKVSVLYDPKDMRRVLISEDGSEPEAIFPVDLEGNRRVSRLPDEEPKDHGRRSIPLTSLEDLADQRDEEAAS
jgi:hypothetical protein